MQVADIERINKLRGLLDAFLKKRLDDKLYRLKGNDTQADFNQQEERSRFEAKTWLDNAAKRSRQLQIVTHIQKATHPDLKLDNSTNLYVLPKQLKSHGYVGTHALGENFSDDATGNAAALDVYDFLTQQFQGKRILDLVSDLDPCLMRAMSDDLDQAKEWVESFVKVTESPCKAPSSSTLAKQVYWLTGGDPTDDKQFHLLAPLYASSLAHRVWETIQDDRFGERAKAARRAQREGRWYDRSIREYPQLAVQQLGGTKPQNISKLNSERRGVNYLFASLPPLWQSRDVKPLLRIGSLFKRFERRTEVRELVHTLASFLKTDPTSSVETRNYRAGLVDLIIDELLQFAAEVRTLDSGWTQSSACWLNEAECHWLDPKGVTSAYLADNKKIPTDTLEQISELFANWLNAKLRTSAGRDSLPVGDPEFLEWRKRLLDQLQLSRSEVNADESSD